MVKFSKSERRMALDVFGDLSNYCIRTDVEKVNVGDIVTITNANCEFEFDNITGTFQNNLLFIYLADLELLEVDYTNFIPEKSNNGGAYAYATCRVVKV